SNPPIRRSREDPSVLKTEVGTSPARASRADVYTGRAWVQARVKVCNECSSRGGAEGAAVVEEKLRHAAASAVNGAVNGVNRQLQIRNARCDSGGDAA